MQSADEGLAEKLEELGIADTYEWSGFRYTNARDAIAAAKRDRSQVASTKTQHQLQCLQWVRSRWTAFIVSRRSAMRLHTRRIPYAAPFPKATVYSRWQTFLGLCFVTIRTCSLAVRTCLPIFGSA